MTPAQRQLFDAVSFAARAHRHQLRKDERTPYVGHPFRVALVLQQVFDCDDAEVLAAAVLHDTIEDTTTDYDDIAEQFGAQVANWVRALTKDKRLPEPERVERYIADLIAAGPAVHLLKIADIYDKIADSQSLASKQRSQVFARAQAYLTQFANVLTKNSRRAFQLTEELLKETRLASDELSLASDEP